MTENTTSPDSTLLWDSPDVEPLSGVFTLRKICAVVTNNSSDT